LQNWAERREAFRQRQQGQQGVGSQGLERSPAEPGRGFGGRGRGGGGEGRRGGGGGIREP
jgi:hypothetical protein